MKYDNATTVPAAGNAAVKRFLRVFAARQNLQTPTNTDKEEILKHFKFQCAYCGCALSNIYDCHWDHIIPRNKAEMGLDTYSNLAPSCPPCNLSKGGKPWGEYLNSKNLNTSHYERLLRRLQTHIQKKPLKAKSKPTPERLKALSDSVSKRAVDEINKLLKELDLAP